MSFVKTHRTKLLLLAASVLVLAVLAAAYVNHRLSQPFLTPQKRAAIKAEVAAQNEAALDIPAPIEGAATAYNRDRNIYFGDLHVHSRLSFDSYIFGNRWSLDDAYRFAQGGVLENPGGEPMQLTQALDFVAITDHAEGFSFPSLCAKPTADLPVEAVEFCAAMDRPTAGFFFELRRNGTNRPMRRSNLGDADKLKAHEDDTWAHIVASADKHNWPGVFTTFPAYEYSPVLADSGKHHRNVIFKNASVPTHALSGYDAAEAPDLWRGLKEACVAPCEVLTIPHNPNKTWGLAFADVTIDGREYTPEDWALREAMEPLVEMFQIKGASECAYGVNTNDEACRFEQFYPPCPPDAVPGETSLCIHPTAMARDGLKKGLLLADTLGFNPLDFGMIGSTDTHNSNPGDAEEWDYRGAAAAFSTPAARRLRRSQAGRHAIERNPGGLAAIWAVENTREALFAAMQRKEVYATSGTRIKLRFYGGFADMRQALQAANPARRADELGVPMGAYMPPGPDAKPSFFVWALRDPTAAPLDKVQLIKSWVENGETRETVLDIACAEGRRADAKGACADLDVALDTAQCALPQGRGAEELKTVWRDTAYQPGQKAFYYVRVLQVESCRWSHYDSVRAGVDIPAGYEAPIAERAWSSPIFIADSGR